jgi:hypothetical protein
MTSRERRLWKELQVFPLASPQAEPGYQFADQLGKRQPAWLPGYINAVILEYRRFLCLHLCSPKDSLIVPSPAVDEAWHLSIANTEQYRVVCAKFLARFLDHQPATSAEKVNVLRQGYSDTLLLYQKVFGKEAPSAIWPKAEPPVGERAPQRFPAVCGENLADSPEKPPSDDSVSSECG